MATSNSNNRGTTVILMKKSSVADFRAWAESHYDNIHWTLTCKIGAVNRDKVLRILERKLRDERIAAEKRKN